MSHKECKFNLVGKTGNHFFSIWPKDDNCLYVLGKVGRNTKALWKRRKVKVLKMARTGALGEARHGTTEGSKNP